MFQQLLFSWGLLELPIPLALKCHVAHHNILVIILQVLPLLHLSGSAAGKGYKCPLHCGFNPSLKHSIHLPVHSEILLPPFLFCNNCVCTILSINATLSRANSLSHASCLSLGTVWGMLKTSCWNPGAKPTITFCCFSHQSASQQSTFNRVSSTCPCISLNTFQQKTCIHVYKYANASSNQTLRNCAALCQEGNTDLGKDLGICLQMQGLHRQRTFFYRIQWLDEPAGECLNWKELPSKH